MRKNRFIIAFLLCLSAVFTLQAQDDDLLLEEETHAKRPNQISFTAGAAQPSLGPDYDIGFYGGGAYLRRLNQALAFSVWGSYGLFRVPGENLGYLGRVPDADRRAYLEGGGDLTFIRAGIAFQLHIIPVRSKTFMTIYAVGRPFGLYYEKGALQGYDQTPGLVNDWTEEYIGTENFENFDTQTGFSGGIQAGVGIEFFPNSPIGLKVEAVSDFTLGIPYIVTGEDAGELDGDTFPVSDSFGFTTLGINASLNINF